jgi:hypothetical protein
MDVKDAAKVLEKAQANLNRLTSDLKALSAEIEPLKEQRAEVVRNFALGDRKQERIALELDRKVTSLRLQGEGLDLLIVEARGELAKAEGELRAAQETERGAEAGFIAEKEQKFLEILRQSVAEREKTLYGLFEALCLGLGDAEIAAWTLDGKGPNPIDEMLRRLAFRFHHRINAELSQTEYTHLQEPLYMRPCLNGFIGGRSVNAGEVAKELSRSRKAEFIEQYRKRPH